MKIGWANALTLGFIESPAGFVSKAFEKEEERRVGREAGITQQVVELMDHNVPEVLHGDISQDLIPQLQIGGGYHYHKR